MNSPIRHGFFVIGFSAPKNLLDVLGCRMSYKKTVSYIIETEISSNHLVDLLDLIYRKYVLSKEKVVNSENV